MKTELSAYLCEVFKWYEHEIVQAGPNIRQTPKWCSTAYYLEEEKEEKGEGEWNVREGKKSRCSICGGYKKNVHERQCSTIQLRK
jgi:hypothetical protein